MEIIGIGTDITECLRIARMIERHGELFISRVYTPDEIRYCQNRKQSTQHFTGRWAAKEAILKAIGTGWRRGISWLDMEIRNDPGGQPIVSDQVTITRPGGLSLRDLACCMPGFPDIDEPVVAIISAADDDSPIAQTAPSPRYPAAPAAR